MLTLDERYSKKAVGRRLKEFRLNLNLTQKEFAEKMHWAENTYRKIETGVALLTSDKAQALHEEYRVDITYLLTGERQKPENLLQEVWVTSSTEENKAMLIHLLEYWIAMLNK